jgi:MFS family permease
MANCSTASVFWRYWSASAISDTGSAVTAVALPLVAVLTLHASAGQVSLIAAAEYVAWIVIGLPAGVITQRLPLRGTQVAADLARAVAIGSIPAAWWIGQLTVVHLVLSALVVSFANVLFDVSNSTFLPAVVSKADLTARNSLMSGTQAATQLGGPSVGGLLVQLVGAVPTLLMDAVSYLVSAVLLRSLPSPAVERPRPGVSTAEMISEGWRFVTRHPVMRPCMETATIVNFVLGGLLALAPVYLVRELHGAPVLVGLLLATEGAGTLIGAALTPRMSRAQGSARAVISGSLLLAVMALLVPSGDGWLGMVCFGVGYAGMACGAVVVSVCARTHRQVASPPDLLSRVMATVRFISWGAIPVGSLVAGGLASLLGVRPAMWIVCLLASLAPLVLLVSSVRRLRELADWAEPERVGQPITR